MSYVLVAPSVALSLLHLMWINYKRIRKEHRKIQQALAHWNAAKIKVYKRLKVKAFTEACLEAARKTARRRQTELDELSSEPEPQGRGGLWDKTKSALQSNHSHVGRKGQSDDSAVSAALFSMDLAFDAATTVRQLKTMIERQRSIPAASIQLSHCATRIDEYEEESVVEVLVRTMHGDGTMRTGPDHACENCPQHRPCICQAIVQMSILGHEGGPMATVSTASMFAPDAAPLSQDSELASSLLSADGKQTDGDGLYSLTVKGPCGAREDEEEITMLFEKQRKTNGAAGIVNFIEMLRLDKSWPGLTTLTGVHTGVHADSFLGIIEAFMVRYMETGTKMDSVVLRVPSQSPMVAKCFERLMMPPTRSEPVHKQGPLRWVESQHVKHVQYFEIQGGELRCFDEAPGDRVSADASKVYIVAGMSVKALTQQDSHEHPQTTRCWHQRCCRRQTRSRRDTKTEQPVLERQILVITKNGDVLTLQARNTMERDSWKYHIEHSQRLRDKQQVARVQHTRDLASLLERPVEFALYMAKQCSELADALPIDHKTCNEYAERFETIALNLVDMSDSLSEIEAVLLGARPRPCGRPSRCASAEKRRSLAARARVPDT